MRVPVPLSEAFGASFEARIRQFCVDRGMIPDADSLTNNRFIARSLVPHVRKLSDLFNRRETAPGLDEDGTPLEPVAPPPSHEAGLDPYWKESSNPANLRLAYFLYFMPCNLYRVAAVWSELARLGFRWKVPGALKALELGAGPASGACGIASGEHYAPVGLPKEGNWALIEQDKKTLELGSKWALDHFAAEGMPWETRDFHRKIDFERGFLPPTAPKFGLWLSSYFLNESSLAPPALARKMLEAWERHLENEGLAILVEPALKAQSRRLLELRRELILLIEREPRFADFKILLPCLGHQTCGALEAPAPNLDWCHDQATWWRPPYFRLIDAMAGLDRRTLPFSYLVIARSKRTREEILPAIAGGSTHRLVSPAHWEGKEQEFFVCGQEGKRRARYRARGDEDPAAELERGDILIGAELRGDSRASRIDTLLGVR